MLIPRLSGFGVGGLTACGKSSHDEDGQEKSREEHEGKGAEVV